MQVAVDSKRLDKLLKRLKPLFEEKLKIKQRLKGLQSFLAVSQELDEVKIFNDNDEMIFEVFYDTFTHRIARIKERLASISSKDAANLYELIDILGKILKYCHVKVNTGWKRDKIFFILEMLSSRSNHTKIRQCGLKLVQIILSNQAIPDSDILRLYSNSVSLDVFKRPTEMENDPGMFDSIEIEENGILGEFKRKMLQGLVTAWSAARSSDEPTVTDIDSISQATPSVIIAREGNELSNNVEIFVDILNYIIDLSSEVAKSGAALNSVNDILNALEGEQGITLIRMWNYFKGSYLKLFFPVVCRAVGIEIKNGDGFIHCPLDLLNALMDFIAKTSTYTGLGGYPQQLPNAIITVLLSKNHENFEIVHEIIRQTFISQNIAVAVYVLTIWIASTHPDGHPFLKRLLAPKLTHSPIKSCTNTPSQDVSSSSKSLPCLLENDRVNDLLVNQMMRRYSKYYQLSIIAGKKKNVDIQSLLLKEALQFYRFLGCEKLHLLDQSTWSLIRTNLLELGDLLPLHKESNELAHLITETILITWIRSKVKSDSVWKKLEGSLSQNIHIVGAASSWAEIMLQFTYIMSESTYGIGLAAIKDEHTRHKRTRMKTRETGGGSSGNIISATTPEPSRKTASPSSGKRSIEDHSELSRISQSSKSTTKASSVSEKNSSNDDGQIDSAPGMQMISDSNEFSQMKDLKDSFSKDSLWIWKNLITCIGKVHEIKDPEIHFQVINCFITVWGVLEKVRIIQPFSQTEMPNLFDFAGIIFKSTIMEPQFSKSAALSAACLGKLMCRYQDYRVDTSWFQIYYTYIIELFTSPVDNVSLALLANSSRLYSLYLTGVTITIPASMQMLGNVCTMKGAPEAAVRSAISMIGSLLVYEKHFRPLLPISPEKTSYSEMPIAAQVNYNPSTSEDATAVFVNLKFGLFNLVQNSLHFHSEIKNEDYCELLLWNLGILYLEESVNPSIKETENLQNEILFLLLEYVSSKSLPLVSAAADSLVLLAENFHRIHIHDETLVHIIDRLAWGISENLSIDENLKRKDLISITSICALLFKCLLEWLMTVPATVVTNPNIALRLSEVIDEAIHVAVVGMDAFQPEKDKESVESVATNKQEFNEIFKIYEHLRESAEATLFHLTHHLDNFPPCNGPAFMNTTIPDPLTEDNTELFDCNYFSYNDSSIIALIERPRENNLCILIRNMTGKYAWNLTPFFHDLEEEIAETHICNPRIPFTTSKINKAPNNLDASSIDSIDITMIGTDPLESTLLRIQSDHPECTYTIPSADSAARSDFQSVIEEFMIDETSVFRACKPPDTVAPPPISTEKGCAIEAARLFLSQTGHLSFDQLKTGKMVQLVKSQHLIRDIRGLDRKYSREVAKLAVLYVGPGQEDEASILKNSAGSYQYDEFVASLGWQVHLDDHSGYAGGLDCTMVNEGLAVYYCSSTVEMIFHDVTRMPTDPADAKQVKKKRHIGNDHVHIVWNEHVRDYRWDTIGGDFANAQIVVTPLANGLYTIDIYRDELVRPFGPLQSRSVISKECLGSFVRCTAMNAYRNALCAGAPKGMEPHPYSTRKQMIELIHSRHKAQNDSFERHLHTVVSSLSEKRSLAAMHLKDIAEDETS